MPGRKAEVGQASRWFGMFGIANKSLIRSITFRLMSLSSLARCTSASVHAGVCDAVRVLSA